LLNVISTTYKSTLTLTVHEDHATACCLVSETFEKAFHSHSDTASSWLHDHTLIACSVVSVFDIHQPWHRCVQHTAVG